MLLLRTLLGSLPVLPPRGFILVELLLETLLLERLDELPLEETLPLLDAELLFLEEVPETLPLLEAELLLLEEELLLLDTALPLFLEELPETLFLEEELDEEEFLVVPSPFLVTEPLFLDWPDIVADDLEELLLDCPETLPLLEAELLLLEEEPETLLERLDEDEALELFDERDWLDDGFEALDEDLEFPAPERDWAPAGTVASPIARAANTVSKLKRVIIVDFKLVNKYNTCRPSF